MLNISIKTKDGDEWISAYDCNEAPLPYVKFHKMQRSKRVFFYGCTFATADTETSHTEHDGWIYQWAVRFGDTYIYGRKPSEFVNLLERMRDFYRLHDTKRIIIYFHNLAYDIQYLKHYLYDYDPNIKILATDSHSVLICDLFGFRILCSYRLSGMNLDLFSNTYAEMYRKAVGEINYNTMRYQDSVLTPEDWHYMMSDVASQYDAIEGYLKVNGYDYAYQAPFTSTGFVRTDCRHRAEKQKYWREKFKLSALTLEQYNLARAAFMGGITISSYLYNGEVVEGKIGHKDFCSSYPARQMFCRMPKGKPMTWGKVKNRKQFDYLLKKYCCLFILIVEKVQIKQGITAPYIPYSKCILIENELKVNGKVVYGERLHMAMTEIDFEIIEKQYNLTHLRVEKMTVFERGESPDWLKGAVMDYFKGKCELKHSDPRLYMSQKAKLNSLYGFSATSLIRQQYELNDILMIQRSEDDNEEKQLSKYYHSYNSFMPYQFSLWVTAAARAALICMIECVGYDKFLYCDTDSVFYLQDEETEKNLQAMNERIRERAIKAGAYIGDNILGVATDEPPIRKFKSLHAKCYAMEELNEKTGEYELKVTIAGIPKKSTKWIDGKPVTRTNAEELGSVEALEEGFIFRHCGGTRCIYVEKEPEIKEVNGHMTELASAAIIENIEKELSNTMFTVGKDYTLLNMHFEQKLE